MTPRAARASIAASLADPGVESYVWWREESARVRLAYGRWHAAERTEWRLAFAAYHAALDREEAAANWHRDVITRSSRVNASGKAATRPAAIRREAGMRPGWLSGGKTNGKR